MRALFVGLLAFVLVTQAAAAAMQAPSAPVRKAQTAQNTFTLDEQLERKLAALRRYRGTIRFYETHRSLLSSSGRRVDVSSALAYAKQRVHQLTKTVEALRAKVHTRDARKLASLTPKAAICAVFGDYCQEAVAVAWCESHLATTHGTASTSACSRWARTSGNCSVTATRTRQAVAAHRYFVRSGRDWSPWSCRWAAA